MRASVAGGPGRLPSDLETDLEPDLACRSWSDEVPNEQDLLPPLRYPNRHQRREARRADAGRWGPNHVRLDYTAGCRAQVQAPEPPAASKPKEKSDFHIWGETFPDALRSLGELHRRESEETAPLRAAHKERIRPFVEQKERTMAAAKAAYEDMVRPFREEYERATRPLR